MILLKHYQVMFYQDPLIYNYSAEKILYRTTTRQTLFGLICEANKIKQNITFYDKKTHSPQFSNIYLHFYIHYTGQGKYSMNVLK